MKMLARFRFSEDRSYDLEFEVTEDIRSLPDLARHPQIHNELKRSKDIKSVLFFQCIGEYELTRT